MVRLTLGTAVLVPLVGVIVRYADPPRLELASSTLAAIMVGAALAGRRLGTRR